MFDTVMIFPYFHGPEIELNYVLLEELKNVEKNIRHEVAQLVETLFYKLEVLGFDACWCHWSF